MSIPAHLVTTLLLVKQDRQDHQLEQSGSAETNGTRQVHIRLESLALDWFTVSF